MSAAPTPADRLANAERDAALARHRLGDTLATLQNRLDPRAFAREGRALVQDTMRDVGDRSAAAAQASLDTARRNPGALAGAAAGLGLFVIGRPLLRLFRRRRASTSHTNQASRPAPVTEGLDR